MQIKPKRQKNTCILPQQLNQASLTRVSELHKQKANTTCSHQSTLKNSSLPGGGKPGDAGHEHSSAHENWEDHCTTQQDALLLCVGTSTT